MRPPIHLGEFHNIIGAARAPYGVSLWDTRDIEYFIELVTPDPTDLIGAYGHPPEEGGFQIVEGIRIPSVRSIEIKPPKQYLYFDVRELQVTTNMATLKWDLYGPRRS